MDDRGLFSLAGVVLASSVAAFAGDRRGPLPADAGDLYAATRVEVRSASGETLMAADLGAVIESGGERERKAVLSGAAGLRGEAEVERVTAPDGTVHEELEVDVEGAAPNAALSVVVDGRELGRFAADAKGEAEIELSGRAGR